MGLSGKGKRQQQRSVLSASSFLHTSSTDLREKSHQQRALGTKLWWSHSELRLKTATGMFLLMPLCRQKHQYFFLWYQLQCYLILILNIILYETICISVFLLLLFSALMSAIILFTHVYHQSLVFYYLCCSISEQPLVQESPWGWIKSYPIYCTMRRSCLSLLCVNNMFLTGNYLP